MFANILAFVLILFWMGLLALGVSLFLHKHRILGLILALEGILAGAATAFLATFQVGIGDTMLRIPLGTLGVMALAAAGIVVAASRALWPLRPTCWDATGAMAALALLAPIASAAGLYGLVYLTTPERERERDADKRAIHLPAGFNAEIYLRPSDAAPMDNLTAITFASDGWLYAADIKSDIWRGKPDPATNTITRMTKFADGFTLAVGLLWLNDELYVASSGKVEALRDTNGDGVADARRTVAKDLPSMILQPHSNNALTLGPDGRIYFGVGTSERVKETSPLGSSILSVSPDGGDVKVFARGFGNPFKLGFNARGDMFTGDNQLTAPDGTDPNDKFNAVKQGGYYGFPIEGVTATPTEPLVAFPPHSVPTGMAFYQDKTYPAEYVDNAFLSLWNRGEVVRIALTRQPDGSYTAIPTRFADGFLYPIDITTGPDGNLYIADFGTTVVYRITYGGK
ncbi:MAG TPA: PQQ-dependent sugar dehydrogenase [Thermoflexales bacterium]|nr:PQQ-dependent sugar dehydrogenase [Thermoflexales bacterium]